VADDRQARGGGKNVRQSKYASFNATDLADWLTIDVAKRIDMKELLPDIERAVDRYVHY
jgi:hypothetical protein